MDCQILCTTRWRIARESSERDKHYSLCCMQQYTCSRHGHIIVYCSWYTTTKGRPTCSMSHCRGKSHWMSTKIIDEDIRSNHIQNTYKFGNFHPRSKIFMMRHRKLLPRNNHGVVIIYQNTYQDHSARNYCTLKF